MILGAIIALTSFLFGYLACMLAGLLNDLVAEEEEKLNS